MSIATTMIAIIEEEKGNNRTNIAQLLLHAYSRYSRATRNVIEPDDIVITDITETNSGLRVTFYVRGQAGVPIDANDVVEAVKASFY